MSTEAPRLEVAPPPTVELPPALAHAREVDAAHGGPDALQAALDAADAGDVLLVRPGRYVAPRLSRGVALHALPGGSVYLGGALIVEDLPAGQTVTLVGRDNAPLELECPLVVRGCEGLVVLQSARLIAPAGAGEPALTALSSAAVLLVDVTVAPAASTAPAAIVAREAHLELRQAVVRAPPRPPGASAGAADGAAGILLEDASLVATDLRADGGAPASGSGGAGGPGLSLVRSRLLAQAETLAGGRGARGPSSPLLLAEASHAEVSPSTRAGRAELDASSTWVASKAPRPSVRLIESIYLGRSALLDVRGPPGASGVLLIGVRPAVGTLADAWSQFGVDFSGPHVVLPLTLPAGGQLSLRTRIPPHLVLGGRGVFAQLISQRDAGGGEPWMSPTAGRLFMLGGRD
jgi:hypothetical protein